jgi:hypothetical protein
MARLRNLRGCNNLSAVWGAADLIYSTSAFRSVIRSGRCQQRVSFAYRFNLSSVGSLRMTSSPFTKCKRNSSSRSRLGRNRGIRGRKFALHAGASQDITNHRDKTDQTQPDKCRCLPYHRSASRHGRMERVVHRVRQAERSETRRSIFGHGRLVVVAGRISSVDEPM